MKEHITKKEWLALDHATRFKIREAFKVGRSENPQIVDDRIVSDGASEHDLAISLNARTISAHLKTKQEDCDVLWGMLIDNMTLRSTPIVETAPEAEVPDAPAAEEKPKAAKKGRPKKK